MHGTLSFQTITDRVPPSTSGVYYTDLHSFDHLSSSGKLYQIGPWQRCFRLGDLVVGLI